MDHGHIFHHWSSSLLPWWPGDWEAAALLEGTEAVEDDVEDELEDEQEDVEDELEDAGDELEDAEDKGMEAVHVPVPGRGRGT